MDSPLERHIPSGALLRKALSPCLLRQREDVRFCTCHFGKQSTFLERTYHRQAVGVSKGACPFREAFQASEIQPGGFWCALCETFFTQESFRGCGPRRPALELSAKSNFRWCGHENETSFILRAFAKRGPRGLSCKDRVLFYKKKRPFVRTLF